MASVQARRPHAALCDGHRVALPVRNVASVPRGHQATGPPGDPLRTPARAPKTPRDCSGLASTRPLTTSRRENDIALGKLVGADAYVEYVMANGR